MKPSHLLPVLVAATLFGGAAAAVAGATNAIISSRATVRDGANVSVDIDEVTAGYVMAKYSTTGGSAKGYFEFDLTGKAPDTNSAATFVVTRPSSSGVQHVRLWALNQPYPGMANTITWATAQANDTANNSMLTAGALTATSISDRLTGSGLATDSYTLPAPWGQFLQNGKLVLVLTTDSDALNNSAGYRVGVTNPATLPRLDFNDTLGNLPPTLSAVGNQTNYANHASGALAFTVSDDTTPAGDIVVFAISSNTNVVPAASFNFTGQGVGANRTVSYTAGAAGTATVTLYATDGSATNFSAFTVTVLPDPSITTPAPTNTIATAPVTSTVTVGDIDLGPDPLTVTGVSSNPSLIPNSGIVVTGTGANRDVTVTANAGVDGVSIISLTASDGVNGTTTVYPVMVRPSASVLFSDHFDYPLGNLSSTAVGLWPLRANGSVRLRSTNQQVQLRATSSGESCISPLPGAPYTSGTLFFGFRARWVQPPGNSAADFISLYDAGGQFRVARVSTSTNGSAPGFFRLAVANISGPVEFTRDLSTNTDYRIVVRYDIDGGLNGGFLSSRLWVDPADDASTSVDAYDVLSPVPVTHVGLRQTTATGEILLDDLKVGLSFADVLPPAAAPRITRIALVGGDVQVDFNGTAGDPTSAYSLLEAAVVSGPFASAAGAVVTELAPGSYRATVTAAGTRAFYRISR
ncbi:MAG: hypothetical protein RJA22_3259 [Verrucomicrobiota bacterium]